MEMLSLGGAWRVAASSPTVPEKLKPVLSEQTIEAHVPGCIHTDLLAAGLIDDPFYRTNEAELFWIGETDWTFSRQIDVPASLLEHEHVVLAIRGLDTPAEVRVNGTAVGSADNEFRGWEFDVSGVLRAGENEVEVAFTAPARLARERQEKHFLWHTGIDHHRLPGGNHLRKSQCNFGWDWGPMFATSGIKESISLCAWSTRRLGAIRLSQEHSGGPVRLRVDGETSGAERRMGDSAPGRSRDGAEKSPRGDYPDGGGADHHANAAPTGADSAGELSVRATLRDPAGAEVAQLETAPDSGGRYTAELTVDEPRLWWPNGLGEQPLYELTVELSGPGGILDRIDRTVGLRTIELDRHDDEWGESFRFLVNGVPVFAKGANWIPADAFVTRIREEQYEELIRAAADANMNMLRVWGGGIYEPEVFYDLCDRHGIMIWQDFMFACSAYPSDREFVQNVEIEAREQIERLHTHACLALWCGNNELEQIPGCIGDGEGRMSWAEYGSIFDELLPRLVREHDPATPYWPSSPHSPHGDRADVQNPKWGDAHLWSVWHGGERFEWYRTCTHRFNSEFGFQSFPEPAVVDSYTAPEDRNITSYVMEYHQRSPAGNAAIIRQMLEWFHMPESHEMVLWSSQILQGLAIRYAVEHWRRSMPRGMGTLYWQLNDCWPVASWSSVDFYGNWKALNYMARSFFAPVLLSCVEDGNSRAAEFHLTNDLLEDVSGELAVRAFTLDGEPVFEESKAVTARRLSSAPVHTSDLAAVLDEHGPRNLIVRGRFVPSGGQTAGAGRRAGKAQRAGAAQRAPADRRTADDAGLQTTVLFARPKHLAMGDPGFEVGDLSIEGGTVTATIRCSRPALWVWPELPGVAVKYSDRFFDLMPGEEKQLTLQVLGDPEELFHSRGREHGLWSAGAAAGSVPSERELRERLALRSIVDFSRAARQR